MREHTRANKRYERSEAGDLTLDWGKNGADYTALDFSYVAKGKMGNMFKVYGQVRRNPDGITYDTYDVKAGNRRLKTRENITLNKAIKAHIEKATGTPVNHKEMKIELPIVPNTARGALWGAVMGAITGWEYCWRGKCKGYDEAKKQEARDAFVRGIEDFSRYYCDPTDKECDYKAVGLVNIDVRNNRTLYRDWRGFCEKLAEA